MPDPHEIPLFSDVLEGQHIKTKDVVYIYREVQVYRERVTSVYMGDPHLIELLNGPILKIRNTYIEICTLGSSPPTVEETWAVANGQIVTIAQGSFPDPNTGMGTDMPVIETFNDIQALIGAKDIYVSYTYAYDFERFDDILDVNHEVSQDSQASQLSLTIGDTYGQYIPSQKDSEKNYNDLFSPSLGTFEPDFGNQIFTSSIAASVQVTNLEHHTGTQSLRIHYGGPAFPWRVDSEIYFSPVGDNFWVSGWIYVDVLTNPIIGKVTQLDDNLVILQENDYTIASAVDPQWVYFKVEQALREDATHVQFSFFGHDAIWFYVDDFRMQEYAPLFDYMKTVDMWTGMEGADGNYYLERTARTYINEIEPTNDGGTTALSVTCFGPLGRLGLSRATIDVRAETQQVGTEESGSPFVKIDDDGLIWAVSSTEYVSLADWEPVIVWARYQGESITNVTSWVYVLGSPIPGGFEMVKRPLRPFPESEYEIDYERGWIIFKSGSLVEECAVTYHRILPYTKEADDVINQILLVPNEPRTNLDNLNLLDQAVYGSYPPGYPVPPQQSVIRDYSQDGGGPGYGIDELTDYNVRETFIHDGVIQDDVYYYFGSKNNFVKPELEAGALNLVSPLYGSNPRQLIGVLVEIRDLSAGPGPWEYITDYNNLWIDYKSGAVGLDGSVLGPDWFGPPDYGLMTGTDMRVSYRYWTIQWTGITANRFEWQHEDGDVSQALEKIRETFLPPNFVIYEDPYGTIIGEYVTEKADGDEDFYSRAETKIGMQSSLQEIATKIVARGKMRKEAEVKYGCWALIGSNDGHTGGYVGPYASSWNTPGAAPQPGQRLAVVGDGDPHNYASWATNDGIVQPYGTRMAVIRFNRIEKITKIVFQVPPAGGERSPMAWVYYPPKYRLKFFENVDDGDWVLERDQIGPGGLWSDWNEMVMTDRSLTPFEIANFNGVGFKTISSGAASFPFQEGGHSGGWHEIEDLPINFKAQYIVIEALAYGRFRNAANDLQWNLADVMFYSGDTLYGVAFLRDRYSGPQPRFNDPDGEFYKPKLLRRLYPNSVRVQVLDEDNSMQDTDSLQEYAREVLREKWRTPDDIVLDCVYGWYGLFKTVKVVDPLLGVSQNYLIVGLTYSKSDGAPMITLNLRHYP